MPCPTCSHTQAKLADTFWHCERCGTVSEIRSDLRNDYVPKLVDRCRGFERMMAMIAIDPMKEWRVFGIAESINLPGERPE